MKISFLITVALTVITFQTFAEELFIAPQDTVKRDSIRIMPNQTKTEIKALPFFGYFGKDNIAFQTYAGYNILNVLRGHVPNLGLSPNASEISSVSGRSGVPMLVIDGLPFVSSMMSNYNMNAFDYESAYMVSNGNGMAPYGGLCASGGIFLQSKTGRNIFKPSFEFNSYTSMTHGRDDADDRFAFTESIAYAQDFGDVDARVSYTNTYAPGNTNFGKYKLTDQNVRLNVGADITKSLNVRVIMDRWGRGTDAKSQYTSGGILINSRGKAQRENLQGNVVIEFQPLTWLRLTSQSSLSKIDLESNSSQNGLGTDFEGEFKRRFMNAFATGTHAIGKNIAIREYAGIQYDRNRYHRAQASLGGPFPGFVEQSYSASTESVIVGAGVNYRTWLYLDFNHRWDKSSALPEDYDLQPSYSISSAFVFSDAFGLTSSAFSMGKVRATYGNMRSRYLNGYPNTFTVSTFDPNSLDRDMLEIGADVTFLKRLNFTLNYYHNADAKTITTIPAGGGGGGIIIEIGGIRNKGTEVMLGVDVVRKAKLNLNTQLIWSKYDVKIDGNYSGSLGSSNPDWTGSMLNQLTLKNFYTSFLIDMRHGGFVYVFPDNVSDATLWKLRDVSVGYQIPSQKRLRANVSLSARNMLTLHKRDDNVEDQEGTTQVNKSVSLSVMLFFE